MINMRSRLVGMLIGLAIGAWGFMLLWRDFHGPLVTTNRPTYWISFCGSLALCFGGAAQAAWLAFHRHSYTRAGEVWRGDVTAEQGSVFTIGPLGGLADRVLVLSVKPQPRVPKVASFRLSTTPLVRIRYRATVIGHRGANADELVSESWEQTIESNPGFAKWMEVELPVDEPYDHYALRLEVVGTHSEPEPRSGPAASPVSFPLRITLKAALRLGDAGRSVSLRGAVLD